MMNVESESFKELVVVNINIKSEIEDFLDVETKNIENIIKIEEIDADDPEIYESKIKEGFISETQNDCDNIKDSISTSITFETNYKGDLIEFKSSHDKKNTIQRLYECDKCYYVGTNKTSLARHYRTHSELYYKCTVCDFNTKYKYNLTQHELLHKAPEECEMFYCHQCDYQSKSKVSLKRHMTSHRILGEADQFKCPYCKFVTKHQSSLNNHIIWLHEHKRDKKYMCSECDFSTMHKTSLKDHTLTHRQPGEVPMFQCSECPYETKNRKFLRSHMKCHKGTVPCPKCQKLITYRGMKVHLKSHEPSEIRNKYKCKICSYGTQYYGNYSRHLKNMHSKREDIEYKFCPQCPYKTFESARLKRHITEIHSAEAPQYNCEQCQFVSKFKSCLKRHVEIAHGDKKRETCPICLKESANIYTLRIHMKIHKNENEIKIFQCKDCPYKSRHSGAYKSHILKHKTEDEVTIYKCINCPFQSKNKRHLIDHISKSLVNTDIQSVDCPYCCFKATVERKLRIHVSKRHKDELDPSELWYCDLCDFKAVSKKRLTNHYSHHKKEKQENYLRNTQEPATDHTASIKIESDSEEPIHSEIQGNS